MILHLQSLHFLIKIPLDFQVFSNTSSRTSYFRLLMLPDAKMLDFGTPLAPGSAQNDGQNHPSGAKVASENSLGNYYLRNCFQG